MGNFRGGDPDSPKGLGYNGGNEGLQKPSLGFELY